MTLSVGDVVLDYSGFRPDPHRVYRDGARAIIRYSAGAGNSSPHTQWKLCGRNEIKRAVAAGLDFIANSEWYESRITEGHGAGLDDGRADRVFWRERGLARGATIYVSWDAAPARRKWPAAVRYLRGYAQGLDGRYEVDCYGGTQFLRYAIKQGAIRMGWRTNAGSWSNDGLPYQPEMDRAMVRRAHAATPAHLWQNGNYWYHRNADENIVLRLPLGTHLEALRAAKPPPCTPAAPTPVHAHTQPRRARHEAHPEVIAAPETHYHPGTAVARSVVSHNGEYALFLFDDGRLEVRHNGSVVNTLAGAQS